MWCKMDTGPASHSETFRISGERGWVYVGTFRIPYSRGLSLALSLPLSAISRLSSSTSFSFLSHASSSSSTLRFLFSSSCRRSYPVGKEDARSKRCRRCVAVAVADGTDAADGAFAMPCRTVA